MNAETITWAWLIAGIVLMVAEKIVPGLVVIFLGLAAVMIAAARWLGWIDGLLDSFTYWFVLSLVIVLGLRGIVSRMFPSEISLSSTNSDEDAIGRIAEVIEEIGNDHENGRIRFRGTTWQARSEFGRIFPSQMAKIVDRDNIVWIVDPVDEGNVSSSKDSIVEKITKSSKISSKKGKRFLTRSIVKGLAKQYSS